MFGGKQAVDGVALSDVQSIGFSLGAGGFDFGGQQLFVDFGFLVARAPDGCLLYTSDAADE